jgi:uncharacterized protein (TIGR02246 family)
MNTKTLAGVVVVIVAVATIALTGQAQPKPKADEPKSAPAVKNRDNDVAAIQKTALAFADAFNKKDAKAIAALWTELGENEEADGETAVGQAEIEKTFAAYFKDSPKGKIEVDIRSIRFPSRDSAIEEGFTRFTPDGPGLPVSALYTTTHVREDGVWKVVSSREYGAGQDRLGDLAFLIGQWEGGPKGQVMSMTFEKDGTSQFIIGKFTRTTDGKPVTSGTIKIGLDGQRGQIRSWHFDVDGGHGQCLWLRDGNQWVMDALGVLADGTETAGINLLTRLSNDELTWRSIDRVVGGEALPNTLPVKLTRVATKK